MPVVAVIVLILLTRLALKMLPNELVIRHDSTCDISFICLFNQAGDVIKIITNFHLKYRHIDKWMEDGVYPKSARRLTMELLEN